MTAQDIILHLAQQMALDRNRETVLLQAAPRAQLVGEDRLPGQGPYQPAPTEGKVQKVLEWKPSLRDGPFPAGLRVGDLRARFVCDCQGGCIVIHTKSHQITVWGSIWGEDPTRVSGRLLIGRWWLEIKDSDSWNVTSAALADQEP